MNTEAKRQGFWEGEASAMTAAREGARNQRKNGNPAAAESILASAHYSRAGTLRTRSRLWLPLVAWHFWRARIHARKLVGYGLSSLSPEQLDVIGTVFRKGPLPDFDLAMTCLHAGLAGLKDDTVPHTIALLYIGLGDCYRQKALQEAAQNWFNMAADLIPRIEKEESDLHGKRQLARVFRHCGKYFKLIGDPRGNEFLQRAEALAREVSSDQLAKIQADG